MGTRRARHMKRTGCCLLREERRYQASFDVIRRVKVLEGERGFCSRYTADDDGRCCSLWQR